MTAAEPGWAAVQRPANEKVAAIGKMHDAVARDFVHNRLPSTPYHVARWYIDDVRVLLDRVAELEAENDSLRQERQELGHSLDQALDLDTQDGAT